MYDRFMMKRDDQIMVAYNPWNEWSNPCGIGVLPPTEEFKPGDLVHYYDRPDCVGMIVARAPQEVEYDGLSTWTPENIYRESDGSVRIKNGKMTMDFYTVVWNTGRIRTAGAHVLHQLRRVA